MVLHSNFPASPYLPLVPNQRWFPATEELRGTGYEKLLPPLVAKVTVSDYPLVEAIHQNVVRHPVLPDAASRAKLADRKSAIFMEKYDDYLR